MPARTSWTYEQASKAFLFKVLVRGVTVHGSVGELGFPDGLESATWPVSGRLAGLAGRARCRSGQQSDARSGKKLFRSFQAELEHEPTTHLFPKRDHIPESGRLWNEDATRGWDAPDARADIRGDPAEVAAVNEYLERLNDRQFNVLSMRVANCTNQEIADELGLSFRIVDREFETIRKGHPYDDAE